MRGAYPSLLGEPAERSLAVRPSTGQDLGQWGGVARHISGYLAAPATVVSVCGRHVRLTRSVSSHLTADSAKAVSDCCVTAPPGAALEGKVEQPTTPWLE